MSKWLEYKPDIRDGLMVVGQYDAVKDDTLYYEVYSYPDLIYKGKYASSRFDSFERYCDKICTYDGIYLSRELFPDMNNDKCYLERIMVGHPHLILPNRQADINYYYNITKSFRPFNEVIDKYLKIYRESQYIKNFKNHFK